MKSLDRRSLCSLLVLSLVLTPLTGALQDKPHRLRAGLSGPHSSFTVVDYQVIGTERALQVRVRDVPLSEVTVVFDEARFAVPLNSSGDGAFSADSRAGRDVPFLKAGDLVAVLGTVRGTPHVLMKGYLKPAD